MNNRMIHEKQFHNEKARTLDIRNLLVRETFESPTALENEYIIKKIGPLNNLRILDLGCGVGEAAIYFAMKGAQVTACDISENMIKLGKQLEVKYVASSIRWVVADATLLPFKSEEFDCVYANGVLHHVNIDDTVLEVLRVMKKSARAFFIEPIPYNPFIKIYRFLAKNMRSLDETPLRRRDISKVAGHFLEFHCNGFWLFSLYIFFNFFIIKRWSPSKVRYWKEVIREGYEHKRMINCIKLIDRKSLKMFPFLKWMCWNVVLEGTK